MLRTAVCISLMFSSLASAALAQESAMLGQADCKIVHPSPKKKLTATWNGACKDGFAEGRGTLEFIANRKVTIHYEGDVRHGAPNGSGYLRHDEAMQYEGGFKDGEFDGTGVMVAWNGRYEGQFKDGEFDGFGKMKFALGGSYEGGWKEGRFHGQGTAVYASGRVFSGEFVDGRPAGEAAEARSDDDFKVRSREPGYGTRLHFNRALASGIPFNKGYHQMSPEERASVRAIYPLLDKDDEPPYPVKGTRQLYTRMSEALGVVGDEGDMLLYVDVDSTGKATRASVFQTPSHDLAKVAMVIALQEKYKPALCAGKPCAMKFPISMRFVLDD